MWMRWRCHMPRQTNPPPPSTIEGQFEMLPGSAARPRTIERSGFVCGLLQELQEQTVRYVEFVGEMAHLQARIEIAERNVRLTREHLESVLGRTNERVPADWE